MKKIKTKFKDLYLFESNRFDDSRGYFRELFLESKTKKKLIFYVSSTSKKYFKRTPFSKTTTCTNICR